MERHKGFTFNIGKNKTEMMIINKQRRKEYNDINVRVKSGKIETTKEYKYLGEWYNEKGNHETFLKKKERKNKLLYQTN